jgi:hypothetical protein
LEELQAFAVPSWNRFVSPLKIELQEQNVSQMGSDACGHLTAISKQFFGGWLLSPQNRSMSMLKSAGKAIAKWYGCAGT